MMKTINKFLILLMLAIPFFGFNGCKDDDGDDEDYATAIAGTYNGPLKVAGTDIVYAENTAIKIERTGDNVATLSTTMTVDLSQYQMGSQDVDIKCLNSAVSKNSDGTYKITGTAKVLQIIDVAVDGVINNAGSATINIGVSATAIPLDLAFVFSGTKAK